MFSYGGEDPFGDVGVGTGDPGGYGAQVVADEGGGVEVAAQVIRGLGGPEGAVLHAFRGTAKANASARRMAVAGSSHPSTGDQQKEEGTAPMYCGLNTCTGPSCARTALVRA
ncbi:MAG TPA: hypothetical protein VEF71_13985 [Streptosporangiaceae bacterium]|nr:hypothetical protein [Streptosporangiaceae bacterium]